MTDRSNIKLNELRNRSLQMDKVVIDYESHIEFPSARAMEEVPAGVYYPNFNRQNNQFLLLKASPLTMANELADTPVKNEAIEDMLRFHLDYTDDYRENVAGRTDYLDRGYFDMVRYHNDLGHVQESIDAFLSNRELYKKHDLGYKRSVLLFGDPGTGKSRYIDHTGHQLIKTHDAIVLRIESPTELDAVLNHGMMTIHRVLKNRLKVFIIEELATLSNRGSTYTELLNFLDHPLLREDVLMLMTTNNPEIIPDNIIDRPSRVDVLARINSEGLKKGFVEAWYKHLMREDMPEEWKYMPFYTMKMSPAYLKELFISMRLHNQSIEEAWEAIQKRRDLIRNNFRETNRVGFH